VTGRKRIVVKLGGRVAAQAAGGILALSEAGHQVCVVHGAGPQISDEMLRRGLPVEFVGGRRVTTREGLEVVRESLAAVNAAVCAAIGARALPLFGDELGLRARHMPELGLVGTPLASGPSVLREALDSGRIPVIAPLARGPLNVNADEMAAALAVGLGADEISFLTDVPGVLIDGAVVGALGADEAAALLAGGRFEGGIVPKLHAAVAAARGGVRAEIGGTAVTL
jgi:acetylglutamate kinase